ncbi:MAG: hypothetical protein V2I62_12340 [Bacteroidales bacterium]|nr:hypothetical protein [Bacteroidales bacterium]
MIKSIIAFFEFILKMGALVMQKNGGQLTAINFLKRAEKIEVQVIPP